MLEIASILLKDIPFVRLDSYECEDKIDFREMTFYHMCGFVPFESEEYYY